MSYHLAQLNIAKFRKPAADPANADFMNALEHVNALAEGSPGFVWRLKDESGNATAIKAFDDPDLAVNMSVWASVDQLAAFAYRNMDHRSYMRRRKEWFEETKVYMVLWWVPAGHLPTLAEAKAKLALLERDGPTAAAFTFKQPFAAPGEAAVKPVLEECS